ncbi:cytochrome P450 [Rhodobacterales bacterium HKCCE2091]|nr:cytochrome P450 [Rhodobacterales bacterium HKCCE2091]
MRYRLTDPAFLADPGPVLARMRAEGPLVTVRLPLVGRVRLTTGDAAARALLKDRRFSRDPTGPTGRPMRRQFWWMPRFMAPMTESLIARDDPDHARLRGLAEGAFARIAVEDLKPELAAIADELLDAAGPARGVDIETAYTRPLPLRAISALLGLPDDLRARVAADIAPLSHVTGPVQAVMALFRMKSALAAFRDHFADLRRAPRPGLASALVEAAGEHGQLTDDELLATVMTLFLAGHETTLHLIGASLHALASDAGLRAHFDAHPDRRGLLIEEFLRHVSPVMMTKMLFANEDLEFEGVPVRRGEKLSAFLLAANHDPARFDDPGRLVPDRRPNPHLGFGHGPHTCLGMQLARAEALVALDRLFARYPATRLADPPPKWLRRPGLHALTGLRLDLA